MSGRAGRMRTPPARARRTRDEEGLLPPAQWRRLDGEDAQRRHLEEDDEEEDELAATPAHWRPAALLARPPRVAAPPPPRVASPREIVRGAPPPRVASNSPILDWVPMAQSPRTPLISFLVDNDGDDSDSADDEMRHRRRARNDEDGNEDEAGDNDNEDDHERQMSPPPQRRRLEAVNNLHRDLHRRAEEFIGRWNLNRYAPAWDVREDDNIDALLDFVFTNLLYAIGVNEDDPDSADLIEFVLGNFLADTAARFRARGRVERAARAAREREAAAAAREREAAAAAVREREAAQAPTNIARTRRGSGRRTLPRSTFDGQYFGHHSGHHSGHHYGHHSRNNKNMYNIK